MHTNTHACAHMHTKKELKGNVPNCQTEIEWEYRNY